MRQDHFTPIEQWAVQSKPRAFGFLLGLALVISVGLAGGTSLLVTVATRGLMPLAVASTP
jgi:hypothetical protein